MFVTQFYARSIPLNFLHVAIQRPLIFSHVSGKRLLGQFIGNITYINVSFFSKSFTRPKPRLSSTLRAYI